MMQIATKYNLVAELALNEYVGFCGDTHYKLFSSCKQYSNSVWGLQALPKMIEKY